MTNKDQTNFKQIQQKTEKYIVGNYKRQNVCFQYGVGELLFDTENRSYIDFHCGISVTNLGHSDADIIEALRSQADRLFHTSNLFYSQEGADLAEALIENSFPGKVFFCNSGTEANELAFKLARRHGVAARKGKSVILSLEKSFHGRTVSAMTLTGQAKVREGFGELLPDIDYIKENDLHSLQEAFSRYSGRIAGLIMEPIIGEGGIIPITNEFANLARKLTLEENALLIFDEIQTGMGRTGKLFCYEHFGFTPDVMTLAKALGSGFPLGAVIVSEKYEPLIAPGMHGSTFGGNHLAMKVAYETLKIIVGRELLQQTTALSEFFFTKLNIMATKYQILQEVRGKGLHIGLEFSIASSEIAERCLKNGLIVNPTAGNVIRIMPPLNISLEKVNEGLAILENVIAEMNSEASK